LETAGCSSWCWIDDRARPGGRHQRCAGNPSHVPFDAEACSEGSSTVKAYRKEWDEQRGCWKDKPRHDLASHGADAFRTLACAYRDLAPPKPEKKPEPMPGVGSITVDEFIKMVDGHRERIRV